MSQSKFAKIFFYEITKKNALIFIDFFKDQFNILTIYHLFMNSLTCFISLLDEIDTRLNDLEKNLDSTFKGASNQTNSDQSSNQMQL